MNPSQENLSSIHKTKASSTRRLLASGADIRSLGLLFILSGTIDLFWILSYPEYALKVFGTTFTGWVGALIKFQHPVIHWAIGIGFWKKQRWAFFTYLLYLLLACLSESVTQWVQGYHPTRMTMIVVSLLFGGYIVTRRHIFR